VHGVLRVVRWRPLRRADRSSRGVVPTVVCLNECDDEGLITGKAMTRRGVESATLKNLKIRVHSIQKNLRHKPLSS
jgi:hypothetical protein